MTKPLVAVQVQDHRFYGRRLALRALCQKAIETAWQYRGPAEVSVVLSDNDTVHDLNLRYRGMDKPTNVLSFENAQKPSKGIPWVAGDIIVAYETVRDEARAQGKPFAAHLTHLLIHGALHLQGYDHLKEQEADEMEALEIKFMRRLSYPNPYPDKEG